MLHLKLIRLGNSGTPNFRCLLVIFSAQNQKSSASYLKEWHPRLVINLLYACTCK